MKFTREIKTAILVITSISLFIWGYSFLKGKDMFGKYTTIFVFFDNVEGLTPSASVTINGLTVGKIAEIKLNPETGKLLVSIRLETNFPISKSSVASLYEPSLIGGKQIAIIPDLSDKNLIKEGDYLTGTISIGTFGKIADKLEPLQAKATELITNGNELIVGVNNVLDTKGQNDMKASLAELRKTLTEFSKASATLNTLLKENQANINGIAENLNKTSNNFAQISEEFNTKTLAELQKNLENLNKITSDMASGKGSVGKILKDEEFYNNLNKTSKELGLLLEDIRLNPTRYVNVSVFGKKNKPYVANTKNVEQNK